MKTIKFLGIFLAIIISVFAGSEVLAQTNSPTITFFGGANHNGFVNINELNYIHVMGATPAGTYIVNATLSDKVGHTVSQTTTVGVGSYPSYSFDIVINGFLAFFVDGPITAKVYITDLMGKSTSSEVVATAILISNPPTMTMNRSGNLSVAYKRPYYDPGATARDSLGNDLTPYIVSTGTDSVNTYNIGNYGITYTVSDMAGNITTLERTVRVVERDGIITYPPAISTTITPTTTPVMVEITQVATTTEAVSTGTEIISQPIIIKTSGLKESVKRQLYLGVRGDDIKLLQTILSGNKDIYPEALITGYFGPLTKMAVQRFQEKYGVATQTTPGYGEVGPRTKAKLIEIFGE